MLRQFLNVSFYVPYGLITVMVLGVLALPSVARSQETKVGAVHAPAGALAGQQAQSEAGAVKENPKDGLKYVWISPGKFMMGCSPDDSGCDAGERPAHSVTISKGFWLGQTEVTVAAYKHYVTATGKQMPLEPSSSGKQLNPGWGDTGVPMVDVTWYDAQAYCGWAGGRLPTEAEWEYAARAGTTAATYGDLDAIAWFADNSGSQHLDSGKLAGDDHLSFLSALNGNGNNTHPVGTKRPNAFGLYDVLGNVWEWVNDWYDPGYYQNSPPQNPPGPPNAQLRVIRGGSWNDFPWVVRVSARQGVFPAYLNTNLGFRCAGEMVEH